MKSKEVQQFVGAAIEKIRKEKNMSREFLASKVNVSLDSIGNYERGQTAMGIDKLAEISRALDVDPGVIISETKSTMLWKYEKLSPRHKEAIKEMIDVCYNDQRHQLPRME